MKRRQFIETKLDMKFVEPPTTYRRAAPKRYEALLTMLRNLPEGKALEVTAEITRHARVVQNYIHRQFPGKFKTTIRNNKIIFWKKVGK